MEPEEVLEQEVDTELDTDTEQVSEQVSEQPVEKEPEVLNITTRGKWVLLETLLAEPLVVGKTYRIKVAGHCQFMVSENEPTTGMVTNEITYTKNESDKLWIKTGL